MYYATVFMSWALGIVGTVLSVICGVVLLLSALFSIQNNGPINNDAKVRLLSCVILLIVGILCAWGGYGLANLVDATSHTPL